MKKLFNLTLLLLFISFDAIAQKDLPPFEDCFEVPPPTFTGTPEPTLCDKFGNIDFKTAIGKGTSFEKSSDIGTSISGNVSIVGDFIVDSPFLFTDAIVKINPKVKIQLKGNSSNVELRIFDSKLFACKDLWEGIVMDDNTSLSTRYSVIEDANKVVTSLNKIYVVFDMKETIFLILINIFLN